MRESTAFATLAIGCGLVAVALVYAISYFADQLCAHGVLHFCS